MNKTWSIQICLSLQFLKECQAEYIRNELFQNLLSMLILFKDYKSNYMHMSLSIIDGFYTILHSKGNMNIYEFKL